MIRVSPDHLDLSLGFLRPVHARVQAKMTDSLIKYGQLTPLIVVEDKGRMILVDGFKRLRCAKELGMESLRVVPLKKSTAEAKALIYLLNRPTGFSMITEALLIRDLVEVEGLNQVETAVLLERHKSWVSRRLSMIRNLTPEIVDDIQLNLVPAGVGPSLARLPGDNQGDFSLAIQTNDLKSQEVKRLVDLWCKTKDPGVRRYLVKSPRKALEVVKQDKEKWLLLIEAILSKMSALNQHLCCGEVSRQTAQRLMEYLEQVKVQMERLNELMARGEQYESIK